MEHAATLSAGSDPESTPIKALGTRGEPTSAGTKGPLAGVVPVSDKAQDQDTKEAANDRRSSKASEDTDRLQARVFELENRLRETEEELEFYFEFFKKAKRSGQTSGTSSKQQREEQEQHSSSQIDHGDEDTDDSDLDGEAPSNANYTGETSVVVRIYIRSSSTGGCGG